MSPGVSEPNINDIVEFTTRTEEGYDSVGGTCLYASVNFIIIGADNDILPIPHQAIIWANATLQLIGL